MSSKVTHGELQSAAKSRGVDPTLTYEELRERIEINTCDWCGDEFIHGWTDRFCTDGCQVQYINEFLDP